MRLLTMLFAALFVFISCSNDDDDKLEGKWQLRQVEENGLITPVDTVFYNFQNVLFMYQVYQPDTDGVRHCYGYKVIEEDKQLVLELEAGDKFLPLTDWNDVKESFTIEKLSGNKMILNRANKRYIFRKF